MKKIIIVIIMALFFVPFFSHSVTYFIENFSQRQKPSLKKQQPLRKSAKVHTVPAVSKNSKEISVPKEEIKTGKFSDENVADTVKKVSGAIKPGDRRDGRNIHDEILGYRLNSKDNIRQIQTALRKIGFYKGEIDGRMGSRTKRAIKEFQKANKLNPDGVVGPKTWEVLERHSKN